MFRLSNLVTTLFGIIAALGTILGIRSGLVNANNLASQPNQQTAQELNSATVATPDADNLTVPQKVVQSIARQVGQNAPGASSETTTTTATATDTSTTRSNGQNPSDPFFTNGSGAEFTTEPEPPATPSEATAIEQDPTPGASATPSTAATTTTTETTPIAQGAAEPETTTRTSAPPSAPTPIRAMW